MSLGKSNIRYLEPEMLHDWLQNGVKVQVLDVRDYDYNEGGHIRGAINYGYRDFQAQLPSIASKELEDPGSNVFVFHCMRSQQRGPRCALRFKKYVDEHYSDYNVVVYVLRGGYINWYNLFSDSPLTEDGK